MSFSTSYLSNNWLISFSCKYNILESCHCNILKIFHFLENNWNIAVKILKYTKVESSVASFKLNAYQCKFIKLCERRKNICGFFCIRLNFSVIISFNGYIFDEYYLLSLLSNFESMFPMTDRTKMKCNFLVSMTIKFYV